MSNLLNIECKKPKSFGINMPICHKYVKEQNIAKLPWKYTQSYFEYINYFTDYIVRFFFFKDRLYIVYLAYESVTEPLWPEEVVVPFDDKKRLEL